MTYNVFGGTLNLAQSIILALASKVKSLALALQVKSLALALQASPCNITALNFDPMTLET